jgi:O-antigen ligase
VGISVRNPELLRRFLFFFFCVALGMTLLGLRSLAALEPGTRLAVLGGGPNVFSRIVGTGLLLMATWCVVLRRAGHKKLPYALAIGLGPAFLIAMYFASSKGPLVGLLLSFLVFAFLNGFLRRTLLVVAVLACVLVGASRRGGAVHDTIQLALASRLFLNPTAELSYGSYGTREEYYEYSAMLIANRPILGVGTGAWGSGRKFFEERAYPHNLFIEVLCEHGTAPFLIVLFYLVWLSRRAWVFLRSIHKTEEHIYGAGLVTCLVFWLINVQISGDLVDNRNLWIFAALLESAARMSPAASSVNAPHQ